MKYTKRIDDIIRNQPWLRKTNINNINDRLSIATQGNAFVVYNYIHNNYELHTFEAYENCGQSYNCSFDINCLNQFLIDDFRENNIALNYERIVSERQMIEKRHDDYENSRFDISGRMKSIERAIGTKI